MGKLAGIILATCMCIVPHQIAAADFDGSAPLLCAVIRAMECGAETGCETGTASSINLPQFFRVDFEEKRLTAVKASGEKRSTPIKTLERIDGKIIIQGGENGRGWSAVIGGETGKMSVAVSGDQVGFVVFGACIPQN